MSTVPARVAATVTLGVVAWLAACASTPEQCDAGFNLCGDLCCSTACQDDGTCTPKSSGSRPTTSSSGFTSSSGGTADPQCKNEVNPSATKFCGGKCIDVSFDRKNCGRCLNDCGEDTNGLSISCFDGKCGGP